MRPIVWHLRRQNRYCDTEPQFKDRDAGEHEPLVLSDGLRESRPYRRGSPVHHGDAHVCIEQMAHSIGSRSCIGGCSRPSGMKGTPSRSMASNTDLRSTFIGSSSTPLPWRLMRTS